MKFAATQGLIRKFESVREGGKRQLRQSEYVALTMTNLAEDRHRKVKTVNHYSFFFIVLLFYVWVQTMLVFAVSPCYGTHTRSSSINNSRIS